MHPAALPGSTEHDLLDRLAQPLVGVGDDEAHPGETASAQRPQEARPERLVFAVADSETENLTVAVRGDASCHDDRFGYDPSAFVGLDVGGIEEHIGELDVIETPLPKLVDRTVELSADPRHLTLGDTGVDPQGGDEVVDLAGADPVHERLHDHRHTPMMRRRGSSRLG